MPALGQDDVADPLAVVEGANPFAFGPAPGQGENAARLLVVARHEVVGDQDHLRRIEQADTETLKDRLHPARPAGVVDHGEIDRTSDDFARPNPVPAAGPRNDLLGKGHSHRQTPR